MTSPTAPERCPTCDDLRARIATVAAEIEHDVGVKRSHDHGRATGGQTCGTSGPLTGAPQSVLRYLDRVVRDLHDDRTRAMLDRVHQVCAAVGVERVTTYSLRGLHGSLARERVSTSAIVAGALGHADRGVTAERHYLDPSAVARSSNRAVAAELGGSARKPKRTR